MEAPSTTKREGASGGDGGGGDGGMAKKKYFTEEVLAHLKEHGWARIRGVLPKSATDEFKQGVETYYKLWDERLTFDNPKAWAPSNLPAGTIHGINKVGGHAWFMWQLRQREEIVAMWADYFACSPEDLRVSFDAFCVYLAQTSRRPQGHWAHFDHGTAPKPFQCLQSAVIMEDCMGFDDGGLVVWDKSHRAHDGYFRENGLECKDNWHLFPMAVSDKGSKLRGERQPFIAEIEKDGRRYLDDDDPEKKSPQPVPMKRKRVKAEAGDVVVWFSDTAHQNEAPTAQGRDRIVAYVSMAPVKHVLKREFVSRRRAFNDRATSSHWAACGFKRNGMPRTYSTDAAVAFKARYEEHLARLPPIELTEVGKRLAGLYDEPHDLPPVLPSKKRSRAEAEVKREEDDDDENEDEEEEEETPPPAKRRSVVSQRSVGEKTAKGRLQKKLKMKSSSSKRR